MITYVDVTEARETERKLRENEERYSRVSEAVAEGIYEPGTSPTVPSTFPTG